MEHRCGVRRNLQLTVLLRRRGWAGSVVAELTNISISGAFIEASTGAFPLHSFVQIETTTPGEASARLMTCRAMVARVAGNGVGLVFDQLRPRGLAALFLPAARSLRPSESPSPLLHSSG